MDIETLLKPEAIRVTGAVSSKKRLFQDIGDVAASTYGLDSAEVAEALRAREGLGPTGVGHGVALPHARLTGLSHVCGVFVVLERPIDFDAVDRAPVDLAFALLAPSESGVDHLKALALVSRTLRDGAVCAKLRANTDSAALMSILSEAQTTKAA